jgi:hypothetical protein
MSDAGEVLVPRDYSAGLEPTAFSRELPRELEARISAAEFASFVESVNACFSDAEAVGAVTVFESVVGVLSCYSLILFYDSAHKRAMARLAHLIKTQNAILFLPRGIRVRNPLFNGCLHIEFLIYPAGGAVVVAR